MDGEQLIKACKEKSLLDLYLLRLSQRLKNIVVSQLIASLMFVRLTSVSLEAIELTYYIAMYCLTL